MSDLTGRAGDAPTALAVSTQSKTSHCLARAPHRRGLAMCTATVGKGGQTGPGVAVGFVLSLGEREQASASCSSRARKQQPQSQFPGPHKGQPRAAGPGFIVYSRRRSVSGRKTGNRIAQQRRTRMKEWMSYRYALMDARHCIGLHMLDGREDCETIRALQRDGGFQHVHGLEGRRLSLCGVMMLRKASSPLRGWAKQWWSGSKLLPLPGRNSFGFGGALSSWVVRALRMCGSGQGWCMDVWTWACVSFLAGPPPHRPLKHGPPTAHTARRHFPSKVHACHGVAFGGSKGLQVSNRSATKIHCVFSRSAWRERTRLIEPIRSRVIPGGSLSLRHSICFLLSPRPIIFLLRSSCPWNSRAYSSIDRAHFLSCFPALCLHADGDPPGLCGSGRTMQTLAWNHPHISSPAIT